MFSRKALLPYLFLSAIAAVLTLISAGDGLLDPGLYVDVPPALLYGAYAQDLIAIVVSVLMLGAMLWSWNGSLRGVLVWLGCLGYLIYGYMLYSFGPELNPFYPAYVAILGASLFSLIGLLGQLRAADVETHIRPGMPRRLIAGILAIPVILIIPWVSFVVEAARTGVEPLLIHVNVIDLAFVIPAYMWVAVLLWRRQTWGVVFAGVLLVKVATMGLSLTVAGVWGALAAGFALDPVQSPIYVLFALLGGVGALLVLRQIDDTTQRPERSAS